MYRYLRYVPKNRLSRAVGRLVHARLPRPVARRLVRWFARNTPWARTSIDWSAASPGTRQVKRTRSASPGRSMTFAPAAMR